MEITTAFLIYTIALMAIPLAGWLVVTATVAIVAVVTGKDWRDAIEPYLEEW